MGKVNVSFCIEMKDLLKTQFSFLVAIAAVSLGGAQASDMLISTTQGSGAYNTTLGNTAVYNFDNLPTGANNNVSWSGVGSIDHVGVLDANVYGGAPSAASPNGTRYAVQSTSTSLGGVATTTLSLNTASSYFGLYWSAGDGANDLKFYRANTLTAEFKSSDLFARLDSSYNGNPLAAHSGDSTEKFAFINFIGDATTAWDKVIFSNNSNSGFESDNWTSRVQAWTPSTDGPALPGDPKLRIKDGVVTSISSLPSDFSAPGAPAPPMTACLAFAGVLLLQAFRRNKSVA